MIGSLLTEALIARGEEFSVMLRSGDSGGRVAGKPGVTSTEGDFDDPASLRGALEGVDRAFLLTNSTESTEAQQIAFVEAAQAQRVGQVVYLSQLAADPQSPVRFLRYHGAVEATLTNSTVGWTFVPPQPDPAGLHPVRAADRPRRAAGANRGGGGQRGRRPGYRRGRSSRIDRGWTRGQDVHRHRPRGCLPRRHRNRPRRRHR